MLIIPKSLFVAQTFPLSFRSLYQLSICIGCSHRHLTSHKCVQSAPLPLPLEVNVSTLHCVGKRQRCTATCSNREPGHEPGSSLRPLCEQGLHRLFFAPPVRNQPASFPPLPMWQPAPPCRILSPLPTTFSPTWASHSVQIIF